MWDCWQKLPRQRPLQSGIAQPSRAGNLPEARTKTHLGCAEHIFVRWGLHPPCSCMPCKLAWAHGPVGPGRSTTENARHIGRGTERAPTPSFAGRFHCKNSGRSGPP